MELVRFLLAKKFSPSVSEGWSPLSKLDALQHWTLLTTRVRKLVGAVVGEIDYCEETAELPDEEKVKRRQAFSFHPIIVIKIIYIYMLPE